MIAKPFSPGNAFPAEEVARERISFDKAFIGSCTNGSYDDLLQAALVLKAARDAGRDRAQREFVIFPGSGGVKRQIEAPEARLQGESVAQVLRSVGAEIRESWCGPCFGQGADALKPGPARHHHLQPELAEPDGRGGRGLPGQPLRRRRLRAPRLHGPAHGAALRWDPETYGI
jgi:homoaconitase/3-isopropylmalate dehydratase large subunit